MEIKQKIPQRDILPNSLTFIVSKNIYSEFRRPFTQTRAEKGFL